MSHIFVSYSSKDREHVKGLVKALRGQGWNVWWDEALVPGTPVYHDAIEQALDNAMCVLVILSENSRTSEYVRLEANYAKGKEIALIPIAIGDVAPPFEFSLFQMARLPEWPSAWDSPAALSIFDAIRSFTGDSRNELGQQAGADSRLHEAISRLGVAPTLIARLPDGAYFKEHFQKSGIAIHDAGAPSALSVFDYWGKSNLPTATPYLIERDGTIFETFPPHAWAFHLGAKFGRNFEQRFIGVNLVAAGPLTKSNGQFFAWWDYKRVAPIPMEDVLDFGGDYRGYRYFHRYTSSQLRSLAELVNRLCRDFEIPRKVPDDFLKYYGGSITAFSGVISHGMVQQYKAEPIPDREMWLRLADDCNLDAVTISVGV